MIEHILNYHILFTTYINILYIYIKFNQFLNSMKLFIKIILAFLLLTSTISSCNNNVSTSSNSKEIAGTWFPQTPSKMYLKIEKQSDSYLVSCITKRGSLKPNISKFVSLLENNSLDLSPLGKITYSPENDLIYFAGNEYYRSPISNTNN